MTRPISTRTHGMIDYAWASAATAWPKRMQDATATAGLLRAAGMAATVNSLVTNYEAGAAPILPMRAHLAIDAVLCSALLISPLFLPRHERRWAIAPLALGASGLVAGLLTQPRSPFEQRVLDPAPVVA